MPITTLDPKTALVIIDLQKGIVGLPTAHPVGPVVAHAAQLARAFRARNLPVVLVNVTGGAPGRSDTGPSKLPLTPGWTDLVPELDQQPTDILVSKQQWGAFHGTALDLSLRRRGVTQIVLVGVATSIGVESTARAAHELGYNVTLAVDAMTDLKKEAHENSLERIFPRLAETGSTQAVLDLLEKMPRA